MAFSRKTRTCINTPGYPPMVPGELSQSSLSSALDGARIVYSDVRLHETALVIAQEVICHLILLIWYFVCKNIPNPILLMASGLANYLCPSSFRFCNNKYHCQKLILLLQAARRNIPILIDSERKREGLEELLNLASYVVCSANFPQARTCFSP